MIFVCSLSQHPVFKLEPRNCFFEVCFMSPPAMTVIYFNTVLSDDEGRQILSSGQGEQTD
jgi:hypothetical protein